MSPAAAAASASSEPAFWELFYLSWGTSHASFRLPELESIAQLLAIPFLLPPFAPSLAARCPTLAHQPFARATGLLQAGPDDDDAGAADAAAKWDVEGRPVCPIALRSEADAARLCARMVSVKSLHKLYRLAPSFPALSAHLSSFPARAPERSWEADVGQAGGEGTHEGTRWRWVVDSWGFASAEIRGQLRELHHLDLKGQIDVKRPELELHLLAEYPLRLTGKEPDPADPPPPTVACWFGSLIAHSPSSALIHKYSLKSRAHIGNTSMESSISLLMASQALSSPGKAVWDPFAGTGSMLLACAEFGAVVWGSDIDGRQMRGVSSSTREKRLARAREEGIKEDTPGILHSATQYGTRDRIADLLTFDVTRCPFRIGGMFDAIVTDPPYGVRAGAKRLGRKDPTKLRREPFVFPAGHPDAGKASHVLPDYLPPFKPYEIADLAVDLVRLARFALRPGGRLVFFLPVVSDRYEPVDVPVVEGMTVVGNSVEDFGKWARRLITLELSPDAKPVPPPVFEPDAFTPLSNPAPASSPSSLPPPFSSPAPDGATPESTPAVAAGAVPTEALAGLSVREPGHKDFRGQYFARFQHKDA